VVAFLVEYDALPELGHACGHNLHGAMSLLAGQALAESLPEIKAEIRIIGTPAEETIGAKLPMAQAGIFDDVDLALMIHTNGGFTSASYRSLAVTGYEFIFQGQSAHASSAPWEGHNALNGLQLFFHALDMLRQHLRPEIQIHGFIKNGGSAPNIVPEKASAIFYFRAPGMEQLQEQLPKIFNCARGAALATSTEVSWNLATSTYRDMLPNKTAEDQMTEILTSLGYEVKNSYTPNGSSDVGEVSWCCPTVQSLLDVSSGQSIPAHTREFAALVASGDKAHRGLINGAKALAMLGCRVIFDQNLRTNIKKDFTNHFLNK
jgi:amidohydrolase